MEEVDREAIKCIYIDEIKKSDEILQKKFKIVDEEETGKISIKDLKKCLRETCLLTPKEINGLIRSIHDKVFKYDEFMEKLFNV